MGTLSGPEIRYQIARDRIRISPFHEDQLNPNSYNLTLSRDLLVYSAPPIWRRTWLAVRGRPWALDMKVDNPVVSMQIPDEGLVLRPGQLYLGATVEHTETRGYVPIIEGRSSVGRLGIWVHVTAGYGDTNFSGTWTLEMTAIRPVRIYAGVQICQIIYSTLEGTAVPYNGKYQGQSGPRSSGLWKEFRAAEQPRV